MLDRRDRIRTLRGWRSERDPPTRAQMAQQLPGGHGVAALYASRSAGQQERFRCATRRGLRLPSPSVRASDEMVYEPQLAYRRSAGISLCRKPNWSRSSASGPTRNQRWLVRPGSRGEGNTERLSPRGCRSRMARARLLACRSRPPELRSTGTRSSECLRDLISSIFLQLEKCMIF